MTKKELKEFKERFETVEKKEFEEAYEEIVKMRHASRICDGLLPNLLYSADLKLSRFYVYVILRDEEERSKARKNSPLFRILGGN